MTTRIEIIKESVSTTAICFLLPCMLLPLYYFIFIEYEISIVNKDFINNLTFYIVLITIALYLSIALLSTVFFTYLYYVMAYDIILFSIGSLLFSVWTWYYFLGLYYSLALTFCAIYFITHYFVKNKIKLNKEAVYQYYIKNEFIHIDGYIDLQKFEKNFYSKKLILKKYSNSGKKDNSPIYPAIAPIAAGISIILNDSGHINFVILFTSFLSFMLILPFIKLFNDTTFPIILELKINEKKLGKRIKYKLDCKRK